MNRVSNQDATMLRRLIREGVPMAFSKCLDDHAVNNWGENTQKDIFRACCELVELVVAKLEVQSLQRESPAQLPISCNESDHSCCCKQLSSFCPALAGNCKEIG